MNLILAFFRLVRWQNLAFIALTQLLFYSCIFLPLYGSRNDAKLVVLMIASVLIAAAGYIINDYFDLNIDRVNKPRKNVIDRVIHRRWAIIWHLALSMSGVILTAVAVGFQYWYLVLANLACVLLLWFYSTSLKRTLLIGNFSISLLTAWTILILFFAFSQPSNAFNTSDQLSIKFFRLAFLYAGFAFILSLIREAVKDVEDMRGDEKYGCRTLPIVTGIRTAKVYTGIWIIILAAVLIILQLYILQFGWWHAVLYCLIFVVLPLLYLLRQLKISVSPPQFTFLSKLTKLIMLSGILSMIFFRFYF